MARTFSTFLAHGLLSQYQIRCPAGHVQGERPIGKVSEAKVQKCKEAFN